MRCASSCASLALLVSVGGIAACAPKASHPARAPGDAVTSADLRNTNEPIEVVLQRKVPGLVVRRTGDGGIALQIRGATSLAGESTAPLFILNGLPFRAGSNGELTGVSAEDIETIKVLKGADAAIYGIDGANGVIVITTKPGGRRP